MANYIKYKKYIWLFLWEKFLEMHCSVKNYSLKLLKMCGQHSFEILSHCIFTRLFSRGGMGLEENTNLFDKMNKYSYKPS